MHFNMGIFNDAATWKVFLMIFCCCPWLLLCYVTNGISLSCDTSMISLETIWMDQSTAPLHTVPGNGWQNGAWVLSFVICWKMFLFPTAHFWRKAFWTFKSLFKDKCRPFLLVVTSFYFHMLQSDLCWMCVSESNNRWKITSSRGFFALSYQLRLECG